MTEKISREELETPYSDVGSINKKEQRDKWENLKRKGKLPPVVANRRDGRLVVVDGELRMDVFDGDIPVEVIEQEEVVEKLLACAYKYLYKEEIGEKEKSEAVKLLGDLELEKLKQYFPEEKAELIKQLHNPETYPDIPGVEDQLEVDEKHRIQMAFSDPEERDRVKKIAEQVREDRDFGTLTEAYHHIATDYIGEPEMSDSQKTDTEISIPGEFIMEVPTG